MINPKENPSEKLFANLCAKQYLKGFVFHSPKYNDPTEKEAGDIVLWVRNYLIVFEVVWRNPSSSGSTKHFIKRIGEKRKQLESDFMVYSRKGNKINLTNEVGDNIKYDKDCFHPENYVGVIIVDSESMLENIHYQSYKKTLDGDFPIAVMTKNDFVDLLIEIDTVPDLLYYLKDRHKYIKSIYSSCPQRFINLNLRTERDIIALYKKNSNSFGDYDCSHLLLDDIWINYRKRFKHKIDARDKENKRTKVTDQLVDFLLNNSNQNEVMSLLAWEIGIKTRRERVILADKIIWALEGLKNKIETRQFAYYSQTTKCWSVFYFQHGEKIGKLEDNLVKMTQLKLFKEINEKSFEYSVFGYGFGKSTIHTENTFDEIFVCIEDAENYPGVPPDKYEEALQYFGATDSRTITEFPV